MHVFTSSKSITFLTNILSLLSIKTNTTISLHHILTCLVTAQTITSVYNTLYCLISHGKNTLVLCVSSRSAENTLVIRCVSLVSQHITSLLAFLITKCVISFSRSKQFCDISCVSYNLTLFLHYLFETSIGSHRLRTQPYKTAFPSFQKPIAGPGCNLCF